MVLFLRARGPTLLSPIGLGQGIFRVRRDEARGTMLLSLPPLKESAAGRLLRRAADNRALTLQALVSAMRAAESR